MGMNRRGELIEEIRQITSQYKDEVPGKRRAWPKAIKDRVRELNEIGMSMSAIGRELGLSYYTLHKWRKSKKRLSGEFHQLPMVVDREAARLVPQVRTAKKTATVAVTGAKAKSKPTNQTVTVTTPEGFRIEGISLSELRMVMESVR